MIRKSELKAGAYYYGTCRNANYARWDGEKFHHWRTKWGNSFLEEIRHPEDEKVWDVFTPEFEIERIPLKCSKQS